MADSSRIYQDIFYMDGSLRDIYVQGTSEQDWQTLLDFLRTSSYPLEFLIGGEYLRTGDGSGGHITH